MKKRYAIRLITTLILFLSIISVSSADLKGYVRANDGAYKWEKISQTEFKEGLVL